ncbi:hypothetical protein HDK64DRAFT_100805 [Phyllosticta capitalensis]|uniref:Uncharacterized protein n=1 Tax=Phyllosticta capitalensis TaxID=121624 RepID=A0ABR1YPG2_9PEZI
MVWVLRARGHYPIAVGQSTRSISFAYNPANTVNWCNQRRALDLESSKKRPTSTGFARPDLSRDQEISFLVAMLKPSEDDIQVHPESVESDTWPTGLMLCKLSMSNLSRSGGLGFQIPIPGPKHVLDSIPPPMLPLVVFLAFSPCVFADLVSFCSCFHLEIRLPAAAVFACLCMPCSLSASTNDTSCADADFQDDLNFGDPA